MFYKIVLTSEVDSTLEELNRRLQVNPLLPSPTLLLAPSQSQGRGQGTHGWYSSYGKNLLPSVFWRHQPLASEHLWSVSEAVALAVLRTYQAYDCAEPFTIKWPNDIFLGNKKIAGILILNSWASHGLDYSRIGIGMNLNEPQFPENLVHATSLKIALGCDVDSEEFADLFQSNLEREMARIYLPEERSKLHEEYHAHLFLQGQTTLFEDQDRGERFEAEVLGVDTQGNLHLRGRDGVERSFAFLQVSFALFKNPME